MAVVAFLIPFVLLGAAVVFVAFSGGPGKAREAYLTKGGRGFRVLLPIVFVVLGLVVPALVLANRSGSAGAVGTLKTTSLTKAQADGKSIFNQQCASCHSLAAVNARGVTGPNLDKIGTVTKGRVLSAIKVGGTGQLRMPKGLLRGSEAQDVADYVAKVAGKN